MPILGEPGAARVAWHLARLRLRRAAGIAAAPVDRCLFGRRRRRRAGWWRRRPAARTRAGQPRPARGRSGAGDNRCGVRRSGRGRGRRRIAGSRVRDALPTDARGLCGRRARGRSGRVHRRNARALEPPGSRGHRSFRGRRSRGRGHRRGGRTRVRPRHGTRRRRPRRSSRPRALACCTCGGGHLRAGRADLVALRAARWWAARSTLSRGYRPVVKVC